MDSGDCVYSAFKDTSDGPEEVYFRGGKNGKAEELKLPEGSVVLYSDGKKLYYCSPADGICEKQLPSIRKQSPKIRSRERISSSPVTAFISQFQATAVLK